MIKTVLVAAVGVCTHTTYQSLWVGKRSVMTKCGKFDFKCHGVCPCLFFSGPPKEQKAQIQDWHLGGSNRTTPLSLYYDMRNEYVNSVTDTRRARDEIYLSVILSHTRAQSISGCVIRVLRWRLVSYTWWGGWGGEGRGASQQDSQLSIYLLQRALGARQSLFTQTPHT